MGMAYVSWSKSLALVSVGYALLRQTFYQVLGTGEEYVFGHPLQFWRTSKTLECLGERCLWQFYTARLALTDVGNAHRPASHRTSELLDYSSANPMRIAETAIHLEPKDGLGSSTHAPGHRWARIHGNNSCLLHRHAASFCMSLVSSVILST